METARSVALQALRISRGYKPFRKGLRGLLPLSRIIGKIPLLQEASLPILRLRITGNFDLA